MQVSSAQAARYGTRGKTITVTTNSYEIVRLPTKKFIQYDVLFLPEVEIRRKRGEIIDKLQTELEPHIFSPQAIFDGNHILFSSHELALPGGAQEFEVSLSARPPRAKSARPVQRVRITRVAAASVHPTDLNTLILGGQQSAQTTTATNLLQLLIRQVPNMKFPNNGRAYYTSAGALPIGGGLEMWRGFFQSVRPSIGRMLVNLDTSTAAFYKSGPVLELCLNLLNVRDIRDLVFPERHENFKRMKSFLNNLRISVKINEGSKGRVKKIRGLTPNAGSFVFLKDGVETTIQQHYRQAYNINLRYPQTFGIVVSPPGSDPTIFPAELCHVLPGQFFKKKLPGELLKKVTTFATMKPQERFQTIQQGIDAKRAGDVSIQAPSLEYANSSFIRDAGMEISSSMLSLTGRVLNPPNLLFGAQEKVIVAGGAWNVVRKRLAETTALNSWAVINFSPLPVQAIESLTSGLIRCCKALGITVQNDQPAAYVPGNGFSPAKALQDVLAIAVAQTKQPPQLVIVVLPQSAEEIRSRVKFWGDVEQGIVTLCIREDKVKRANDQYYNNVALKVNARLGGANCFVFSPVLSQLASCRDGKKYMIIGADVGHPGAGITHRPSIASLVWSHDRWATRYMAISGVQEPRTEMISDLEAMMEKAIVSFARLNNGPPQRLIFYRDGLSEGEFQTVIDQEIKAIESACAKVWAAKNEKKLALPLITFIVVGKRHHVRFFPNNRSDADRTGNCPAGFIADKGISSPIAFDFFLQSHGGLLGTSRPSHYTVLKDDNFGNQVDDLQELSYSLCHVYAKATRSVSIPAPVYYADIVCARAAFYFSENLRYADETTTTTSGGSNTFDLNRWTSGYHEISATNKYNRSMYFL